MGRGGIEKLKLNQLKTKKPGLIADGSNLYLRTFKAKDGATLMRSWIFRFRLPGQKERDMGLGSYPAIGLADARNLASIYRPLLVQGLDPIAHREKISAESRAEESKRAAIPTFEQCAKDYIAAHRASWRNAKHAAQWPSTMETYVYPTIGKMRVDEVGTDDVLKVIKPIWYEKTDTAKRIRGRLETVLNYATVMKKRSGDNPARWRGYLDNVLARPSKIAKVKHHTALHYSEIGAFMAELRAREGIGGLALQACILTGVRTSDVVNAKHADVDRSARVWVIPEFSKTHAEHRVPLSKAALAVFDKAREITRDIGGAVGKSKLVFPNDRNGKALSPNAMLAVIARMGRKGAMTTHGARSTFRTWVQEQTNFPHDLGEMSLGHTVGDDVVRAYARGDALKKRLAVMEAWAQYCGRAQADAKVIQFSAKG